VNPADPGDPGGTTQVRINILTLSTFIYKNNLCDSVKKNKKIIVVLLEV
jgi:hypothetical protein